jgi:hypothetical protein
MGFDKRVWSAFIVIVIVYWLTFLGVEGPKYMLNVKPLMKNLISLALILTVSVVGYQGWRFYPSKWTRQLWATIYVAVLILLGTVGLIDLFFPISGKFRALTSNLKFFFISPVPYAVIMLLHAKSKSFRK